MTALVPEVPAFEFPADWVPLPWSVLQPDMVSTTIEGPEPLWAYHAGREWVTDRTVVLAADLFDAPWPQDRQKEALGNRPTAQLTKHLSPPPAGRVTTGETTGRFALWRIAPLLAAGLQVQTDTLPQNAHALWLDDQLVGAVMPNTSPGHGRHVHGSGAADWWRILLDISIGLTDDKAIDPDHVDVWAVSYAATVALLGDERPFLDEDDRS